MVAKRFVVGLSCGILVLAVSLFAVLEKASQNIIKDEKNIQKTQVKQVTPKKIEPKYDLYTNSLYDMPLASIMDISRLPLNVKKEIDLVLEQAQGFYLLDYNETKKTVKIFLQNSISEKNTYNRHGLEVLEIKLKDDGSFEKEIYSLGFDGEENEIENAVDGVYDKYDIWTFDKSQEPYMPLKHKKYDERGKLLFIEVWDYSSDEGVKYQMKNSKNKIISIYKETLEDAVNLRHEHIFYDEKGNTAKSLTINYDGANVTRFTCFDAETPDENYTIISEYSDGNKVGETVYNQNYQPIKVFKMEYVDGVRKTLIQFDTEEKEIARISS